MAGFESPEAERAFNEDMLLQAEGYALMAEMEQYECDTCGEKCVNCHCLPDSCYPDDDYRDRDYYKRFGLDDDPQYEESDLHHEW